MSETLIEIRDLHCWYGTHAVLSGGALRLERGARIGLTGANGTGKSTFFHLIMGLVPRWKGHLEILGKPRLSPLDFVEVRRRVGLLFQDSDDQLFCPTVIEDVAFGPLNLGKTPDEARDIAVRTLERLGLVGFEDRVTYKLSGGEKRLVALAGVLAMEPEILLLDEPCSGLDEAAEERLTRILLELPQEMIVASHDRAFLSCVTNTTYQLRGGQFMTADDIPTI